MKKLYIILTADIHVIGGMQLYTAGKADFLLKNDWDVKILYDGDKKKEFKIKQLEKFNEGSFSYLSSDPFIFSDNIRKKAVNKILEFIGNVNDYEEILIESQSDFTALWGELLAKKCNCQHICFNCNEQFRGKTKVYIDHIDFFKYKYDRKELLGLHSDTMKKLFDGYYAIKEEDSIVFDALEPNPVQDVASDFVSTLKKEDYNIAYIGRAEKGYVSKIIESVNVFAKNHPSNNIQFIMIGDTKQIVELLNNKLTNKNIILKTPGDMVPIPKSLFNKIDVVIAGAVCAELSARQGVPTIVADCENYLSNGVLGYTTYNSMYCENGNRQEEYFETLEDVLINKTYLNNEYIFAEEPSANETFEKHLEYYHNSNIKIEHFIFNIKSKKAKISKRIMSYLKVLFPKLYYFYLDLFD